jgi:hypothetical protein
MNFEEATVKSLHLVFNIQTCKSTPEYTKVPLAQLDICGDAHRNYFEKAYRLGL